MLFRPVRICCAALTCGVVLAAGAQTPPQKTPQSAQEWYALGQAAVQRNKALKPNTNRATNVILFIGDGMGISTVTAARILEGQQRGVDGEANRLTFEQLPYSAFSVTASANQQTSDSAPTATALMTGAKANDGTLSVDQSIRDNETDAAVTSAKSLKSLLERAEERGLSTGVVTTARVTHATPASTYAHIANRDWESDAELPERATVKDIARQLIDFSYGNGIEVVLGGGRAYFLPGTQADPEDAGLNGIRKDGRDLPKEWTRKHSNSAYVWNRKQFDAIDPRTTDHLLGLFERSHMRYEADRISDRAGEPSLAEMTAKAIEILKRNSKGYFLLVEGGRIDHAHHAGNAYRALTDTIAMAAAVKKAQEMTSDQETLIVVTADHSHTLTMVGYPSRGNPILGKAAFGTRLQVDRNGLPYTTLSYANGPGVIFDGTRREFDGATETAVEVRSENRGRRPNLSAVDTTRPGYMQEGVVPMSDETHGGEDVPIYAGGPHSYLFHGALEQHVVFHVIAEAYGWNEANR